MVRRRFWVSRSTTVRHWSWPKTHRVLGRGGKRVRREGRAVRSGGRAAGGRRALRGGRAVAPEGRRRRSADHGPEPSVGDCWSERRWPKRSHTDERLRHHRRRPLADHRRNARHRAESPWGTWPAVSGRTRMPWLRGLSERGRRQHHRHHRALPRPIRARLAPEFPALSGLGGRIEFAPCWSTGEWSF